MSETVTEVQNTLDNERMTYRKKEENWRHEISMLTASKNSAESTVTELQRQIRDLTDRSSAAHQDLETTTNELANLKAHTQVILQEHLRLESLEVKSWRVMERKDEQIVDLEKQRTSMQTLIKQMQEKEQTWITDRASLMKKLEIAQSKQAAAERRVNEMKTRRPSLREETGVILDSHHLSEAVVQASLSKHGVSLVDLYTRLLKLEEECEQAHKDKEEAEL